jgi:mycobactin peptide synthetase MbtE
MDKKVLFTVLDQVAEANPENIAIEETGRSTTYRAMVSNADRIANCLLSENVKKAEEVATFLTCGATYLSSIMGINKAGGIFMALDVEYPIKRMEYILHHAKPRLILTDEQHLPKLLEVIGELELKHDFIEKILLISSLDTVIQTGTFSGEEFQLSEEKTYPETAVELMVNGDDSMYLVNTSGSTGNPKMIEGMHKSLSHFIHWEVNDFKLSQKTRGCILARLSFDLSLREMFAPLLAGGTLCIPTSEIKAQPVRLIEWMGLSGINLIHPIPSIFRQIMKEIKNNPSLGDNVTGLENILFAGEALFGRDIAEWRSIGGDKASLANLYGPSETTLAKICNRICTNDYQPNEIIPLGKPLPNTSILIISDNLLCSPNVIGEIYIKTPFRSKGYFKEPGMTREKFIQNPLHNDYEDIVYQTGDLAKYYEDGTIAFTGRQDSQVKIRGNRVELPEIEKAIMNYPDVKQAVVLPVKNADGENVITCYYVGDAYFDKENLRTYLKDYLPEYMFPSYYIHLEEFPLNLNGKIDRRALPKPEELLYDQLSFEAPTNELEEKLAVMWAEVLNLKKVGINNSFYELGGHSLSVTKILSRIYKELGIEILLKEIFENATIKKLAKLLSGKEQTAFRSITRVATQPWYDLSYSQTSIWLFEQTERESAAFNIPAAFFLYGKLDVNDLQKACNQLIERHESLRTTFTLAEGKPVQQIHDTIEFTIEYIKDEIAETETEFDIARYFEPAAGKPFDIEKGPLLRALLVETGSDKHLLLFTIHHIISDGWSIMVLINEITALYNAIRAGKPNPLTPLSIQYKDYAVWLNELLAGDKAPVLKQYWADKLSGDLPLVEFPADYSRKENATFNGDVLYFDLPVEINNQINKLNLKYGTTSFITFLALVNIVLHKFTGKRDLIVGTPLAGREHVDLEGIIGIFVNVLPIRNQVEEADTFLAFLNKVKKAVFETYEYQHYPFELISQNAGLSNRNKMLQLVDVLVQSQTMVPVEESQLSEIYVKPCYLNNKTSKVDLTFDLSPNKHQSSTVSIEYNTDLFSYETIEGIKDNMLHLFSVVLGNVNTAIADLKLLASSQEEEEEMNFRKLMLNN